MCSLLSFECVIFKLLIFKLCAICYQNYTVLKIAMVEYRLAMKTWNVYSAQWTIKYAVPTCALPLFPEKITARAFFCSIVHFKLFRVIFCNSKKKVYFLPFHQWEAMFAPPPSLHAPV